MPQTRLIISIGFALFSMFFGSGNLVFPITLGQENSESFIPATIGILLTGVLVPFLGVLGMLIYQGNLQSFFRLFGKHGAFIFSLIALGLLGPFGVVARCLTVSHGALTLLVSDLSLPLTSLILCAVIFIFAVNKSRIVSLLGFTLTPFLLISLAAIGVFGLWGRELPTQTSFDSLSAINDGILQGYQTMDLLAAFFFSQFAIGHLRNQLSARGEESTLFKTFFLSSLVGMLLLSIVYLLLVALGAAYAPMLNGVPPQEMLGLIALECLGPFAAPCVCLAIVFACMTTALVLASLFAEFLKNEICDGKINSKTALIITLSIGLSISILDFNGIAAILGPIIETIYPALIIVTLCNIAIGAYQMCYQQKSA